VFSVKELRRKDSEGDWLPIVDEIRNYSGTEMAAYQDILETLL
jgi:hypothetical protein